MMAALAKQQPDAVTLARKQQPPCVAAEFGIMRVPLQACFRTSSSSHLLALMQAKYSRLCPGLQVICSCKECQEQDIHAESAKRRVKIQ